MPLAVKTAAASRAKTSPLDAAVMADGNGLRQIRLIEILCNCLRCAADHIDIHPARARAEHAAQACRTKLQIAVERVGDLSASDCIASSSVRSSGSSPAAQATARIVFLPVPYL